MEEEWSTNKHTVQFTYRDHVGDLRVKRTVCHAHLSPSSGCRV